MKTKSDKAIDKMLKGRKVVAELPYVVVNKLLLEHLAQTKQLPDNENGTYLTRISKVNGNFLVFILPTQLNNMPFDIVIKTPDDDDSVFLNLE